MEENKVPKEVLDITAEFIKIAKKHDLYDFNLEFRLKKGDTLKNTVSWNWGRHGDNSNYASVFSEMRLHERVTIK